MLRLQYYFNKMFIIYKIFFFECVSYDIGDNNLDHLSHFVKVPISVSFENTLVDTKIKFGARSRLGNAVHYSSKNISKISSYTVGL